MIAAFVPPVLKTSPSPAVRALTQGKSHSQSTWPSVPNGWSRHWWYLREGNQVERVLLSVSPSCLSINVHFLESMYKLKFNGKKYPQKALDGLQEASENGSNVAWMNLQAAGLWVLSPKPPAQQPYEQRPSSSGPSTQGKSALRPLGCSQDNRRPPGASRPPWDNTCPSPAVHRGAGFQSTSERYHSHTGYWLKGQD